MEGTVTYLAQTTADTAPVIFRTELALDVKLDIKEQFVQPVFFASLFFLFMIDNYQYYFHYFVDLLSGSVFAKKLYSYVN